MYWFKFLIWIFRPKAFDFIDALKMAYDAIKLKLTDLIEDEKPVPVASRLDEIDEKNLAFTKEGENIIYPVAATIDLPDSSLSGNTLKTLCEKIMDNSRTVSFKELAVGQHIRWYNVEDNETIDAVIVRIVSIHRKSGTSVCIAKTEEGTQFLIDNTNVKDIELIP